MIETPRTMHAGDTAESATHRDLLAALSGTVADGERDLGLRTRRAISQAARKRRAERADGHRNLFLAVLITGALTLLLAPAIWAGMQEIWSGATLVDLPIMLAALGMMLFAGVAASLFLLREDRRTAQNLRQTRR